MEHDEYLPRLRAEGPRASEVFDLQFFPGRGWHVIVYDKTALSSQAMAVEAFEERLKRLVHIRDEQREAVGLGT